MEIPDEIEKVQVKIWYPGGRRIVFRTTKPADFEFSDEVERELEEVPGWHAGVLGVPRMIPLDTGMELVFTIKPSSQHGVMYELHDVKPGKKVPEWDDVRPTMNQWAIGMAKAAATRGECTRRKVGAIVLNTEKRIVGAGYNGASTKEPSCLTGACPRATSDVEPGSSYDTGPGACIAIHAEANALLDAGRYAFNGELYVSEPICDGCLKLAKGARIAWVHCSKPDGTIDSIPIR